MTRSYSTAAKKVTAPETTVSIIKSDSRHSSLEQNLSDDNQDNNNNTTSTIEEEENAQKTQKIVEIAGEVYSLDTKSNKSSSISEKVEDVHDIIAKKRQEKNSKKSTNNNSPSSSYSKKFKTMDGNKFFKQYKPKYQRYDYAARVVKDNDDDDDDVHLFYFINCKIPHKNSNR